MITKDTEQQLYEIILTSNILTRKDFISLNLNYNDINKLISSGIIERIKNGQFQLVSVKGLYKYGKSLLATDEDKASLYFEKCLELEPNHKDSYLELILINLRRQNYQKVLELLNNFNNLNNSEYNNLYLYLLSFIIDIPKEYQEQVLNLKETDLTIPQASVEENNKIRNYVINNEFLQAFGAFNKIDSVRRTPKTEDTIIKELLSLTILEEKKVREKILKLASDEEYSELVTVLENKKSKLNINEVQILKLTKVIIKIIETNELPIPKVNNTNSIFEAIEGNNFKLANQLNLEYLETYKLNKENDVLGILLHKINELTSKFQSKEETTKEIISIKEASVSTEEDINQNLNETIDFTDVLLKLLDGNIEKSLELLKEYLKIKNKLEYEYLIINLIKLSILDDDKTFYNSISTLIEIDKNIYNFNISIYLQEFYLSISLNKLEHAQIYLNIIKKYSNITENIINDLENSLRLTQSNQTENTTILSNNQESKTTNQSEYLDKATTNETVSNKEERKNISKDIQPSKTITEADIEKERIFLLNRLSLMKERNQVVVLLKKMPYERRIAIYKAVKSIPELIATGIGEEPQNVFLRYVKPGIERLSKKELLTKMSESLSKKDFPSCIKYGRRVLEDPTYSPFYGKNYAQIFSQLGLSYNIIGGRREAIKYLTIATEINKNDPNGKAKYDHTALINSIKYNIPEEESERKTKVTMKEHEFNENLNINFGIKNIEEIAYYISSQKLTIDDGCKHFNLTEEETQLVKLIYARDYFIEGMDEFGNRLLQEVEKSKNKSKNVIKILNNIRSNKKFYKERINKHTRKRSLICQATHN